MAEAPVASIQNLALSPPTSFGAESFNLISRPHSSFACPANRDSINQKPYNQHIALPWRIFAERHPDGPAQLLKGGPRFKRRAWALVENLKHHGQTKLGLVCCPTSIIFPSNDPKLRESPLTRPVAKLIVRPYYGYRQEAIAKNTEEINPRNGCCRDQAKKTASK